MQTFLDFLDTDIGAALVGLAFAVGTFTAGALAIWPELFLSLVIL